jgi:DNA-binding NarL/FixJ family response regulator
MTARILLVDDHDVVRRGLKALLEARDGWTVCGEARSGREAVALAQRLQPQVAIVDLTMPGLNGLDTTRQILKVSACTQVLILTMHYSESLVHELLQVGARGYALKTDGGRDIVAAVERLLRHQTYLSAQVSETVMEGFLRAGRGERIEDPGVSLTPREREIIQLLAEGHRNKNVAHLLGISVKTVETHRSAIMRKIGANSITQIVRYAVRNNLSPV